MDDAVEHPGVPGPSNTWMAIPGVNAWTTAQE